MYARFLYALGLDVPSGEIILEDTNEPFLGVLFLLCTVGISQSPNEHAWTQDAWSVKPGVCVCRDHVHTVRERVRCNQYIYTYDWKETHPKTRSGCDMKSVIRSSMLRGSRTNVGKVTLDRSIPTL